MLSKDERKIVLRAIRSETVISVSQESDVNIRKINESDIHMKNFVDTIWENAERRLRREGQAELCQRDKLGDFDGRHTIRTIMGNMRMAHHDLRDSLPPGTDMAKLVLWDTIWMEQKAKNKRMRALDAESLPKKIRIAQDEGAASSARPDVAGTGTIMRTVYNSLCTHLIGIPHEALKEGHMLGAGAFGEAKEYKISGISFLPEHITYCGKRYKGESLSKFESFQAEQGMQVLHPSIVRCIAFTKEAPWITIFPLFNGGSLGDMLLQIPFRDSSFVKSMFRLDHGWKAPPPNDIQLNEFQIAKVREVVLNMPNIMHALVDGIAAAHSAGIIHTDLHPFNIMLDFTRDVKARIGIIDWGCMLRLPKKRASLNFVAEADKHPDKVAQAQSTARVERQKRGWMAPELYDPFCANAYSGASDVYALGYLFNVLHEFWVVAQRKWMQHTDVEQITMETIMYKVKNWMYIENREERKPILQVASFFKSLTTEPARAQRPLVELSVSFIPV